jgi:hypothetical protein
VIGPDGPVAGASVRLAALSDAACAALNDKGLQDPNAGLSDAEFQQLQDCMRPIANESTDAQGRYVVENVPAGWYALDIHWEQNQAPNMTLQPLPTEAGYGSRVIGTEYRGLQQLDVSVDEGNPGVYSMDFFNPSLDFAADAELTIDFIW